MQNNKINQDDEEPKSIFKRFIYWINEREQ